MNLFGKISFILWLITLAAIAVMFDWFDSREIASSALEFLQGAVERLEATGDQVQDVVEVASDDNVIDDATGAVKETFE